MAVYETTARVDYRRMMRKDKRSMASDLMSSYDLLWKWHDSLPECERKLKQEIMSVIADIGRV